MSVLSQVRLVLSIAALVSLGAGYFASQYYGLNQEAPTWSKMIDTPLVAAISLLLLISSIALSFVKEKP